MAAQLRPVPAPELTPTRRRSLARQYNLSVEDFTLLWKMQLGRCALCQRPFTKARQWYVDHCHRTGEVRGLLCYRDNYELLGYWGDDAELYERTARYLLDAPADLLPGDHRRVPNAPPLE